MSSIVDIYAIRSEVEVFRVMKVSTPQQLGDAVRIARRQRGLTQSQLAALAGVSRQHLLAVEHATVSPTWDLLARLMGALDLEVSVAMRAPDGSAPTSADRIDLDALLEAHRDRPASKASLSGTGPGSTTNKMGAKAPKKGAPGNG